MTTRSTVLDAELGGMAVRLTTLLPGLTTEQALAALREAGAVRTLPFGQLSKHLDEFPDALSSGDARCPLTVVRLTHVLAGLGIEEVRRPGCGDCGRDDVSLRLSGPNGRRCQNCYNRANHRPCSNCGTVARIVAKDPSGGSGWCARCRGQDPRFHEECRDCGRRRLVVRRLPDGAALCQFCAPRPLHTCIICRNTAPAHTLTDEGAVCRLCYPKVQPQRPCGQCGQMSRIEIRAKADGTPDLCWTCALHEEACEECGRYRRVACGPDGRLLCPTCRLRLFGRPERKCARCAQHRPVQAEWPIGPVCNQCYYQARTHPGDCARCRQSRVLIGADLAGQGLCGPCCGTDLDYLCRSCGQAGEMHADRRCARCVLTDRLNDQLAGPDGRLSAPMQQLATAVIAIEQPRSALKWLNSSTAAHLIIDLAAQGSPFTHQALDALAPSPRVHFVRNLLIYAGVLPGRADYLERLNPWLDQLPADKPLRHTTVIRPFTQWAILRRARHRNANGRAFTTGSAARAREYIRTALRFLEWLDDRNLELGTLTQPHLDEWLVAASQPDTIRPFLKWGLRHRLITADITLPPSRRTRVPEEFLDEDLRWQQLDQCLTDDAMPLDVRVAGALILLFGLGTTRVLRLTTYNLRTQDGDTYLVLDQHPLLLPPRLAKLMLAKGRRRAPSPGHRPRPQPQPTPFPRPHLRPADRPRTPPTQARQIRHQTQAEPQRRSPGPRRRSPGGCHRRHPRPAHQHQRPLGPPRK